MFYFKAIDSKACQYSNRACTRKVENKYRNVLDKFQV